MRFFLCGDVMTGRGVDQILPHPCDPALFERYCSSALDYVRLAERSSGPIPRPVSLDYIWGDALLEIDSQAADLRIANLETSITANGVPEAKGINYRMHPDNIGCLAIAKIDCCVLSNNHVADWGMPALSDTVRYLAQAGIASAGAGDNAEAAGRPALLHAAAGRRVLVFGFGCPSAGVSAHWAARRQRPGVNFLGDLGDAAVARVIRGTEQCQSAGDLVVVSIHWGPNWGYEIPQAHRQFAHRLIDEAGVGLVHGHSSHHPIGMEIYRGRPILYGCGDFINDYEGIRGHEALRPDLALAYFVDIDDRDHRCRGFEMVAFRRTRFRLVRAEYDDAVWLAEVLSRRSRGCRIAKGDDALISLSAA
ncbi:CapA family protein [Ensifer sp. LC163]|uniref:CapA family protein n=1 Tax=Ensifer sp. LC163 TaxID=1120652 RepID=UPI0008137C99|nr:CapA family protein [Ensifer sp. LC163]OCP15066.1 hypothetical protein BC360_17280 [Ensifer sp. LC163]